MRRQGCFEVGDIRGLECLLMSLLSSLFFGGILEG